MPEIRFPFFQKVNFRRLGMPTLLVLIAILVTTGSVFAHPLGNFTVNRYSRVEIGAKAVDLVYVVDMAEIPTHRLRTEIDIDGNGTISEAEQAQYLRSEATTLAQNLRLEVDGRAVALTNQSLQMHFAEGQAGLPTTRIEARFQAPLAVFNEVTVLHYEDQNFSGQLGWQEVVARAVNGVKLQDSSVPNADLSDELRNYPSDLLSNPPSVNEAITTFRLGGVAQSEPQSQSVQSQSVQSQSAQGTGSVQAAIGKPTDGFADLINTENLTPLALLLALLAAFGWGAAHAMSPGHGKTIVGAYLVGARGTVNHAIFLGLTTTITHTAGVFALGFVTLFLSNFILPETLYPWLGVASGLMIVVLGLTMSWSRLKGVLGIHQSANPHHEHWHEHEHDHHLEHDHDHATDQHATHNTQNALYHDHGDGHYHSHLPPEMDGAVSWRSLLALGVSGGLIPCPSALILMLAAISVHRVGFGLLLIFIFSLGLASVLSGVGILLVKARGLFDKVAVEGRTIRYLPVASAVLITLVGIGITWQALLSTGVVKFGIATLQSLQIAQIF